jgi:penicillin-binding protein 2
VEFSLQLKDRTRELKLIKLRLTAAMLMVIVLLGVLLLRLAYLQIVEHEHYTTLSQDNRVKVLPLAPTRGLIYTQDGVLVAENRPAFSLDVVPERVPGMDDSLRRLRQVIDLTDADVERFRQALKQKRRFENVSLRFNLTEEEVARFSVDRHHFPGFDITASLSRYYPQGALLAHVLGYVGRIDEDDLNTLDAANYSATTQIGKGGVEQTYENELHGRVGYQQVEVNSQGRVLRVLENSPAVSGADLHLTLNLSLQQAATQALAGRRGAVVALDPDTGGVLAFVSLPSYDPNPFVKGIGVAQYAALRDSPERPLYNRALQATYPPGSTIKPFMALAALNYGVRTPAATTWCPGWFMLPNDERKYHCWKKTGHGRMDLKEAIVESCDVYFYELAQDLKIDRMHDFLDRFGFGRKTDIDLPGEAGGVNPSRAWKQATRRKPWYPGETLIAGIGQGFQLVTPLQLAHAASVLAKHGMSVPPHLASSLHRSPPAAEELISTPADDAITMHQPHWDLVSSAMHEVVQGNRGTARHSGEGATFDYAGKTGTSQLFGIKQDEEGENVEDTNIPERLRDHGLFIAYAPLSAPRVAVAVVVENGSSGSSSAAPVARQVLDHYLLKILTLSPAAPHGQT